MKLQELTLRAINRAFYYIDRQLCCIKSEIKTIIETGGTVIPGGSTGQVLQKDSNIDGVYSWHTPSGGGGSNILRVLSSAFTNPTDYNNPALVGQDLGIFLNEINRYLEDSEWQSTGTGIKILIPGFDATIDTYTLLITPVTTIS